MDENSTTESMGAICMLTSMLLKPAIFGANTARQRAMSMLATVASCKIPPACTKPRSGRPSGTMLPASSVQDESHRLADTLAQLFHSRPKSPEARPLRPSSQSGAASCEDSQSPTSVPRAPSPPDSTYSPPLRLP